MKRVRLLPSTFLVAILWFPSCSSAGLTIETWPDPLPFKGTACDIRMITNQGDRLLGWAGPVLGIVDLPFSFALDTVLVPINFIQWLTWDVPGMEQDE